jgi:predicted Zn-dependent protease
MKRTADDAAEQHFETVAAAIDAALVPGERHTTWFSSEETDFVRVNRGRVRQPGHVAQRYIEIRLIHGLRHASMSLALTGDVNEDVLVVSSAVLRLRQALPALADDPHLLLPTTVASTHSVRGDALPATEAMLDTLLDAARGHDLVGLIANGPVRRAFASSEGQRNWHAVQSFNVQWSLYFHADKAVKVSYSGLVYDERDLRERMARAVDELALVGIAPKSLEPGRYRAYIAPAAMEEITQLLAWGAFSARAIETKNSALARMRSGGRLDRRITISENFASGIAPSFQAEGFARPANIPLVADGELVGALVSPRTAREFQIETNGANGAESPEALEMNGGELRAAEALQALGTGLAIGNLWYLNYSDRPAARMTGMTRFATFWVENGAVVAPVNALRFDDSLYRMLGTNLEALTVERELMLDASTYGSRSLQSVTLPGVLVSEMNFTL